MPTVGQGVVDLDGAALGKVDKVYRETESATLRTEPVGGESRFGIGCLEVGARVEGPGRTLYIPFSEITALDELVHVNVHKAAVVYRD